MNSWIKESIFYHIYPLGFCGAPQNNDLTSKPIPRLDKIQKWIPHLKALGINALYLGPVFESTSHGYDTIDYFKVDRRLGTNDLLKDISDTLHKNGIKLILDGVFNHVGRDFPKFNDLVLNKQNSNYSSWFSGVNFNGNTVYNDGFSYDSWNGYYNLVKLNTYNSEVKNYIFKIIKFWIEEFDIDGIRLDAADCLELNFLKELSQYCKRLKPDMLLLGEIIHGDYSRWANSECLDTVTNYECYKGLYSSHNTINYFEIAYSLNRQFGNGGIYKNIPLYNFVDNHDVNRIASTLTDLENIYPLYTLLFTMPGIPSIYYGSEFGIKGTKKNGSDSELRPEINLNDFDNLKDSQKLLKFIQLVSRIRTTSKALKKGSYNQLFISNKQYVFLRSFEDENIITAANCSKEDSKIKFNIKGKCLLDLITKETFDIENQTVILPVSKNKARILKLEK